MSSDISNDHDLISQNEIDLREVNGRYYGRHLPSDDLPRVDGNPQNYREPIKLSGIYFEAPELESYRRKGHTRSVIGCGRRILPHKKFYRD